VSHKLVSNLKLCGSWLASESGVSAGKYSECADAIAGKPGSHRFCGVNTLFSFAPDIVGAGLPAMAVCQPVKELNVLAVSLASQLPQGDAFSAKT
jgi:hypothetical protein